MKNVQFHSLCTGIDKILVSSISTNFELLLKNLILDFLKSNSKLKVLIFTIAITESVYLGGGNLKMIHLERLLSYKQILYKAVKGLLGQALWLRKLVTSEPSLFLKCH
jgi:hypothetical protein